MSVELFLLLPITSTLFIFNLLIFSLYFSESVKIKTLSISFVKDACLAENIIYDEKNKIGISNKIKIYQIRKNLKKENVRGYIIKEHFLNNKMDLLDNIYSLDEIISATKKLNFKDGMVLNNLNIQNILNKDLVGNNFYKKINIEDGTLLIYLKEDITFDESLKLKKILLEILINKLDDLKYLNYSSVMKILKDYTKFK